MKKVIFLITALTILFCSCEKTQCKSRIYNNCYYFPFGININVNGKIKHIKIDESIKVPYRSTIILNGKRYVMNDCGRQYVITDNPTGDMYIF